MTSADKSAYGEKDAFGGQEVAATYRQINRRLYARRMSPFA